MPDLFDLDIQVESNVDRLSEHAVHRMLGELLTDTVEDVEEFLRFIVPKGDTDRLSEAVSSSAAHETDVGLEAAVGIPPIETVQGLSPAVKDLFQPGEQDSDDYPLYVDRGTGIFGPAGVPITARHVHVMHFDDADGFDIFRSEVKGQEGAHFMLASYAFSLIVLETRLKEFDERVKHLATSGESL